MMAPEDMRATSDNLLRLAERCYLDQPQSLPGIAGGITELRSTLWKIAAEICERLDRIEAFR